MSIGGLTGLSINGGIAKGALTGWFDAEGTCGSFNPNGYKYDAPRATPTNKDVVKLMAQLLDIFKIHYTVGSQQNKEFISPKTRKKHKPRSDKT